MTAFELKVLTTLKRVPRGRVTTYAALARASGHPRSARAVGNALHKNPWAPQVPCHRVVKSDGSLGGYGGGERRKIELLKKEGVSVKNYRIVAFNQILYNFC